jgi:HEAT repeat protein
VSSLKFRNSWLLFGAVALLVAALGLLTVLVRFNGETALPLTPLVLQWREGTTQAYDVRVDSSFQMTAPGVSTAQAMTVLLDGILEFRTLEVGAEDVLVGMRLPAVAMRVAGESSPDTNRALTRPFRVRFALSGHPTAFEFPAAVTAEIRGVIENLVRMFQVTIQQGETWVVQESNASGVYEAAYVRINPARVEKTKQRYLGSPSAAADAIADIASIASNESIRIDKERDWITAMTVEETFRTADVNAPPVEVTNHASLKLRSALSPNASSASDVWTFVATSTSESKGQVQIDVPVLSREEAEQQLLAGVATLNAADNGRSLQVRHLRDLLLVDGALPFVLLEIMREQELTDQTRADLYLVFELAGSPEAQVALGSVLADPTWTPLDTMRAIVALGGVKNPTGATLTALWDTAQGGEQGGAQGDLPGTAVLALGSLGGKLYTAGDANYSSLRADLLSGAFSTPDPYQRAIFVQALGSTTDPSLQSDIIPLLNDPAPGIRSAAAQTLGRLGTDDVVAEQLMLRFEQESNNTVRGAIADALVSWESPSPAAMASIRSAIRLEPDEDARYNMARFLANNLAEFPENRIVLENLLRSEQSQRIRQQISEMLLAARQM